MDIVSLVKQHGSVSEAARTTGIARSTLYDRYQAQLKKQKQETESNTGRILSGLCSIKEKPIKVLYFTDAHDRVDVDKERFKWLGKFARDSKPDVIVNGGDTFDVDSLNAHVRNETADGKLKPAYEKELASLAQALAYMDMYCPPEIPKHIVLGNHEYRIWRYENQNPEVYGMLSSAFIGLLERHNYKITKFKYYLDIGGVEFTHAVIGPMGKERGGDTGTKTAAKKAQRDIVFGHTHKKEEAVDSRDGPDNRSVRAVNGGCFMPHGYRMDYAKCSSNVWDYGCMEIQICGGKIESTNWISMLELERRYGDD